MKIQIKNLESKIIKAIRKKARVKKNQGKTSSKINKIGRKVLKLVVDQVKSSDTYLSLRSGVLKMEFGLTEEVFSVFDNEIENLFDFYYFYDFPDYGGKSVFSINIDFSPRPQNDPEMKAAIARTSYVSERSGELIEWLSWLLFSGSTTVVENWRVSKREGRGRSRMGVMIGPNKSFDFSVDNNFAGIEGSNLVSKSIQLAMPEIEKIFRETFE